MWLPYKILHNHFNLKKNKDQANKITSLKNVTMQLDMLQKIKLASTIRRSERRLSAMVGTHVSLLGFTNRWVGVQMAGRMENMMAARESKQRQKTLIKTPSMQ